MHRKLFAMLCAGVLFAAGVTGASAWSGAGHDFQIGKRALKGVALTSDQKLVGFRTGLPQFARTLGTIRGLSGDDRLVGIDYRPATGELYGLGDNGGVYVVDDRNARATLKSRLSVPLDGTSFGVDFNPVVDRLRVVSDSGQNLRDNVDAEGDTLVDGTLTYPGPPPATAVGVGGAAYTNNDSDPNTATTLFDIDSMLDQTVIQSPANSGLLAATGKLTVDAGAAVGFDIADRQGFASLAVDGRTRLYGISLLTGRADSLGSFPSRHDVTGIAIPTKQH